MSTPNGVFCYYVFGDDMNTRLRELREDNDLTQEQCAKIAFISKNSYIRYENGERTPPLDTILAFAEYYGTSLDYIAGYTDVKIPYKRRNP